MVSPNATKQALVVTFAGLGSWISIHTGDPGTTGANEVTGGSPAYARQQTTWPTGANGVKAGSVVTIDLPAGTYGWAGLWSAASGGTFVDKVAISLGGALASQAKIDIAPTTNIS